MGEKDKTKELAFNRELGVSFRHNKVFLTLGSFSEPWAGSGSWARLLQKPEHP